MEEPSTSMQSHALESILDPQNSSEKDDYLALPIGIAAEELAQHKGHSDLKTADEQLRVNSEQEQEDSAAGEPSDDAGQASKTLENISSSISSKSSLPGLGTNRKDLSSMAEATDAVNNIAEDAFAEVDVLSEADTSRVDTPNQEPLVVNSISRTHEVDEPTSVDNEKASENVIALAQKPSNTLIGGLLASDKSLKPFRSPMTGRARNLANFELCKSVEETPTKASSSSLASNAQISSASRPVVTPYRPPSSTIATARRVNKPFRSPFTSKTVTKDTNVSASLNGSPRSSLQLSLALPALEHRLVMLKNAKRHLQAKEKGLETADNTTHILELSLKWLNAGREAAEILWALTKDYYAESGENEVGGFGGSSFNNTAFGGGTSNWGWAAEDEGENIRRNIEEELGSLSEKDRAEANKAIDDDEERDPLRDISIESGKRTKSVAVDASYDSSREDGAKIARLDEMRSATDDRARRREEEEEVEVVSQDENDDDLEVLSSRGMARMLTQCGIDTKTFGWNKTREEWNAVDDNQRLEA
ncbi:MAG: hypothetical protein CYPHOPRED_001489 [Cyphobasidiales sp. Tagirdzhanova-0007]|nr:MAG: hypothetical protein CYPHOPRED_001489 [Cyphobasidiales sp. Tagirdzhanova-0007]